MGDWVILFRKDLFSRPNLLSSKMIAFFGGCTLDYELDGKFV